MPEIILDVHRFRTPIDHPDRSIIPAKLDASLPGKIVPWYLMASMYDILHHENPNADHTYTLINATFADLAYIVISIDGMRMPIRNQYPTWGSGYVHAMYTGATTQDHLLYRYGAGTATTLGYEAVDLSAYHYLFGISVSGSSFKCYRGWVTAKTISSVTPRFTVTDTTYASGYWGVGFVRGGHQHYHQVAYFTPSFSEGVKALYIVEVEVTGSGKPYDPYRPLLSERLVPIEDSPELKRVEELRELGFTDEEIEIVFGLKPQRFIDLDAVTIGAFEFSEMMSTNIIAIYSSNPYDDGAIGRQTDFARRRGLKVFRSPRSYEEARELYSKLRKEFTHWLAGLHSFCYHVLGDMVFDILQVVDFYYGELIDHKTHYDQLKRVHDWMIRDRLIEIRNMLSKINVLTEERDKHIRKIDEILSRGW
jgi:hypothetical protein